MPKPSSGEVAHEEVQFRTSEENGSIEEEEADSSKAGWDRGEARK